MARSGAGVALERESLADQRGVGELYRHAIAPFQPVSNYTQTTHPALCSRSPSLIETEEFTSPVCRDPDDDWALATAAVGRCHCIVTGDRDLLVLKRRQGIHIVAPGGFWAYEAGRA